jgi:hypothetical protein
MRVDSVTNVLGWEDNRRVSEIRTTYHYDKGPSVTTVARVSETFMVYNSRGVPIVSKPSGSNVDITV